MCNLLKKVISFCFKIKEIITFVQCYKVFRLVICCIYLKCYHKCLVTFLKRYQLLEKTLQKLFNNTGSLLKKHYKKCLLTLLKCCLSIKEISLKAFGNILANVTVNM